MEDYTIARDAYGNHYLSHGIEWKNHKYIKKLGQGKLALYFYTPEELKKYLQNVAKKAQETGESIKTAGQEVAKKMQITSETANAVKSNAQEVSQRAQSGLRQTAKETKTAVGRTTSEVKRVAKEVKEQLGDSSKTKSSETRTTPHAQPALSSNPKKNQEKLDKVKKDDLVLLADKSQDAAESKKDAEGTGVKEGSSAHGLTSHRKNVTGSAKEDWSKTREVVPGQNKVDLNDVATALGGKTAMGEDYSKEYIKGALQSFAAELDAERERAKELEFEINRNKEALEDVNAQLKSYQDNWTFVNGLKMPGDKIRQLNKDQKKLESEIKDAEFDLTMKKNMYNLGVVQFDKLLGHYKDTYM